MTEVKVRQNGPLIVTGENVTLVDWDGNAYPKKGGPFALCRCGTSQNKPFCDGAHNGVGFVAAETAPTDEALT